MLAYFIIPNSFPLQVGGLEMLLNQTFRGLSIDGTAAWYYDEFVEDGTEYGVKVEIRGLSLAESLGVLAAITDICEEQYGDVRVEVA